MDAVFSSSSTEVAAISGGGRGGLKAETSSFELILVMSQELDSLYVRAQSGSFDTLVFDVEIVKMLSKVEVIS
jgi:hypothetical protein